MAFGKTRADSIDSVKHIGKRLAEFNVKTMEELPLHLRKQLRKEAEDIALNVVFGSDHKKDADGNPIEHGIGSPENETSHSVAAFEKYANMTLPENIEALAQKRKNLAICEAKRRAEEKRIEELEEANG